MTGLPTGFFTGCHSFQTTHTVAPLLSSSFLFSLYGDWELHGHLALPKQSPRTKDSRAEKGSFGVTLVCTHSCETLYKEGLLSEDPQWALQGRRYPCPTLALSWEVDKGSPQGHSQGPSRRWFWKEEGMGTVEKQKCHHCSPITVYNWMSQPGVGFGLFLRETEIMAFWDETYFFFFLTCQWSVQLKPSLMVSPVFNFLSTHQKVAVLL